MTETEKILTDIVQNIIINNLRHLNQSIEDFNNLLNRDPELALRNLSMLSKEDQQTPPEIIEKMIDLAGWKLPDGSLCKTDIYLDPCCGRGGMLTYLYKYYNIPKENLFGIDIKQENVILCNKFGFNTIKGNALEKETWDELRNKIKNIKGENMTINKVLMNPPYDGILHLQILKKTLQECSDAEIVNLSPIRELQKDYLFNTKVVDKMLYPKDLIVVPIEEACQAFKANIRNDLGIYVFSKTKDQNSYQLFKYKELLDKFMEKTIDPLSNHLSEKPEELFLKITDGATLYGNGKITEATFKIVANSYKSACTFTDAGHTKYLNFIDENYRKNAFNFYSSIIMRVYIYLRCNSYPAHKFIPYVDFSKSWSEKDICEYFKLTQSELQMLAACAKELTLSEDYLKEI